MADPAIRFTVQIEETMAFAADQEPAGLEIRVNFGVFGGRDATSAELDELGKLLVPEVGEVSIVAEQRHEMSPDAEVVVHQVRVAIPPESVPGDAAERKALSERLVGLSEIWARSCISERHADISEL
jgi:hypothetical protein